MSTATTKTAVVVADSDDRLHNRPFTAASAATAATAATSTRVQRQPPQRPACTHATTARTPATMRTHTAATLFVTGGLLVSCVEGGSSETSSHGSEGGCGHADPSITGDNISLLTSFMCLLIILTIIIESFTDWLSEIVSGHYSKMLNEIYRQLMVLGLVAFILFAVEFSATGGIFEKEIEKAYHNSAPEQHIIFEVVHIGLFLSMIIYIALSVLFMVLASIVSRGYKQYEASPVTNEDIVRYEELKAEYGSAWLGFSADYREYIQLDYKFEYREIRHAFISEHDLPADFNFATFLKDAFHDLLTRLVELDWRTWLILMGVVIFNWFRARFFGEFEPEKAYNYVLPYGFAVVVVGLVVDIKVRYLYRQVIDQDYAIDDDTLRDLLLEPGADGKLRISGENIGDPDVGNGGQVTPNGTRGRGGSVSPIGVGPRTNETRSVSPASTVPEQRTRSRRGSVVMRVIAREQGDGAGPTALTSIPSQAVLGNFEPASASDGDDASRNGRVTPDKAESSGRVSPGLPPMRPTTPPRRNKVAPQHPADRGTPSPIIVGPNGQNEDGDGGEVDPYHGLFDVEENSCKRCCCGPYPRNLYAGVFWFSRPQFIERILQVCLLLISWYFGLVLTYVSKWYWYMTVIAFMPLFLIAILVVPSTLPMFSIIYRIGDVDTAAELIETSKKLKSKSHQVMLTRSVAPVHSRRGSVADLGGQASHRGTEARSPVTPTPAGEVSVETALRIVAAESENERLRADVDRLRTEMMTLRSSLARSSSLVHIGKPAPHQGGDTDDEGNFDETQPAFRRSRRESASSMSL